MAHDVGQATFKMSLAYPSTSFNQFTVSTISRIVQIDNDILCGNAIRMHIAVLERLLLCCNVQAASRGS
eukprot:3827205-Pleurochrysis_carterae.AAC.1